MESGALERTSGGRRQAALAALAAALLPAAGFALLLAAPELDVRWQHHPSHFWLVMLAAATTAGLAYATGDAADRRGDTRLFLVSLSFLAAGGFLALHALATPDVFLESSNLGFQIAVPVGLVIAALFAAASTVSETAAGLASLRAVERRLRAALVAMMLLWALATVVGLAPLDRVTEVERASGPIAIPAVAGAVLFAIAAVRYLGLARRRRELLPLAVATGFVLLAEAILATAFARNWHASWWEWHLLILVAFALVAWAARQEWREERFAPLYTEETTRGAREISVVFADLAGFTAYSEGRDPRQVSEMLNAYFEATIPPIVHEHGGRIDKLIGDALMATFGEQAGEDDHAVRAARAAVAIRDRARALAQQHPDWPRFRIGVNTGEAMVGVVGAGPGRSYTAIGDAVNLASRLESEAPVGEIAIGAETMRRLAAPRVERLGDLRIKGKRDPVEAYVLIEL
ncbi:MAG: adenylate/guanylate cyclase domain-containing protein [Solirubrobacterales bacterium]